MFIYEPRRVMRRVSQWIAQIRKVAVFRHNGTVDSSSPNHEVVGDVNPIQTNYHVQRLRLKFSMAPLHNQVK